MLNQLNKIGFFQFDNLVKNRIPFMLFNMGPDLINWYFSIYKTHLETYQTLTSPEQVLIDIEAKMTTKDFAIVLVCQDGQQSSKLFIDLEKKGYTNVYVVDGGYQQMMTERSQV